MIDSLWVDAWHLLWGAISSDENILHDAKVSGDIDQYGFNDGFYITLSINFVGS
jgi:hypothetical protein